MNPQLTALSIATVAVLLSAWAEYRHARRVRAVARLAFGPQGQPRRWTRGAPVACVLACGLLAWGLSILATIEPELLETTGRDAPESLKPEDLQRVLILLDVSPSMNIADAGEKNDQRRRDRILEVTEKVFSRIALGRTRFSVIAFFTSARPVVVDTSDVAVIRNVLDNLPLVWSFEPGDTNLLEALRTAGELAQDWPPHSTTLFLCTDGDSTDLSRLPPLPRSIQRVNILAVGDPLKGTLIHNHDSRQQASLLRRLAAELRGSYYDVNTRHMPTAALADLAYVPPQPARLGLRLKDFALLAVAIGSGVLVLMPVALEYFGSGWKADRELPQPAEKPELVA